MKYTFCGIDSHAETHTAVFLDPFFELIGELTIPNIPSQFPQFLKDAEQFLIHGTTLCFGFEDHTRYGRGLVRFLLEGKHLVKCVSSNLVKSERDAQNVLKKTDSIDAECAARVLISRFDKLPLACINDDYWVLGNLVARRNMIVKTHTMMKNQLHSLLIDNYPSYKKFFCNIDGVAALAFYEHFSSSEKLAAVSADELHTFFHEHARGTLRPDKAKLILKLVSSDGARIIENQEIRDFNIQSIIRQMRFNQSELKRIDGQIKLFLKHFDHYPLTSMAGIDVATAAKIIVEVGNIDRFPTAATLASYAGISPVTHASGKGSVQFANKFGNRALKDELFHLAKRQIMPLGKTGLIINPHLYHYYQKKLKDGKTKRQALKALQRRLITILWKIMKYNRPYINPEPIKLKDLEEGATIHV